MRNPFDQFNDPRFREALRHLQELQNNPAYQAYMRELERRQNDPLYEHAIRDMERLHNDPRYQAMLEDLKRQQNDPSYKAKLDALRDERRRNYHDILSSFSDTSQMQDLLKTNAVLRANELDSFTSRFRNQQIQILLDAKKLQDSDQVIRTLEELRRAQEFYDNQLRPGNLLRQEPIHFNPPTETQPVEKVELTEKEQISADAFLVDLQTKYEELLNELADNQQLVLYAVFNGFTIKVSSCVAETYNRIRLNGTIGGNETVILVKQSDFNILFVKETVEPEKEKRKIGFIIEKEIIDDEDF